HHLLLGLRIGAAPVPWHSTDSAFMLLRLSMPLILASSVTFVIGFMLIPWVLGMLTVFYLAGIVSNLSVLGRAILFPSSLFGPMVVKEEGTKIQNSARPGTKREMTTDWGPVIAAVVLFILLSPGLLFQLPARTRVIEFGNMYTSGISILVHGILFFAILTILVIAIGVHLHVG
ncbi:unnamed protein product, partial [Musa acuminata var. zebrina]